MKPENGDTWQFAAVPFEAGNHLSQTSKQKHMPSWLVTEKCITNPILGPKKLPSAPSAVCQWATNGWRDHGRALTAVSGLRCSSTFAKIATKFAFSSQQQDSGAALGVQRPLIGLASENVADYIFHPLTSARAFSHQWTDLTSTQWHTAFTDLNGTPQETKSDLANYAIPMSTIPLRSAISRI